MSLDITELRAVVAKEMDLPADAVGYDDDLVSLGMHSMKLMRLAARWRKQGYEVRSSELALEPTLASWSKLLGVATEPTPAPVVVAQSGDEFELATMQHAYWLGRRQDQQLGGVAAHLYVEFDGAGIDTQRLGRAVQRLLRRHDMLRAEFLDSGTQRIAEGRDAFTSVDLTAAADPAADLERLRQAKSHQRMDVEAGQVIDITATTLPDGRHRIHVDVDMLAADAQSYRRILDDLAALYEDAECLRPLDYTFREYLAARPTAVPVRPADKQWWAEKIDSMPDIPSLPVVPEADRAEPAASIRLHHWFDADARARLNAHAHGNGVTPAVALATVFAEAIARWSAQQRFLLNVPLFAREPLHDDVDEVVGDFTNSVLVDVDARTPESLLDRAKRLQRELHTCAAHSSYEGLDVLRDLGRARGGAVTPSVVFTSGLDLGELFAERVTRVFGDPVWILSQGPQVDLDAQAVELNGGLLVNWDIRRDSLPAGVAQEMFAAFRTTLEAMTADGADWSQPLALPLPAEQRAVRASANDTARDVGGPRSLHNAFFAVAQQSPERPAVLWADGAQTYGELAKAALSVAGALVERGVRPGDTVAVVIPKGHRQIPAVLGVLAAGATYLPIGVGQPPARRDRIIARGNARIALVDAAFAGDTAFDGNTLLLDDALAHAPAASAHVTDPNATAYVLFTSGSTGEPKGVEVSHRAAANTIDALNAHFGIGADDRHIGLSSLEFDLSVFDIFSPLGLGGALVCVDAAAERDAAAWLRLIAQHGVSVVNCAPGLVGMLLDAQDGELRSVRVLVTGGDRVPASYGHRLRELVPGARFAGLGGTTETAIHSTVYEVDDAFPAEWANVPYGAPLANVALRVVNERGEDAPDWVLGELWIGGVSVADGYRGDPERTAQRFVEADGVRWYRTGDLARYLPDGTVDFLGRADYQVKIRGYRVELGEVESALKSLDGVREAVATVSDNGRLLAAVAGSRNDVRAALLDLLPSHMVPDVVEVLDRIPLTANGKLDRAAIRRILTAGDVAGRPEPVAPATDLEAAVEYIVGQVLEVERVGVETDFFDIGGNSILATTLTARIRGLLAVESFGVSAVLDGRTVRAISAHLLSRETTPGRLGQVAGILLELAGVRQSDPVA